MVSYIKIEEYVTLCQRALKKETPLEQIEALTNAKKIMCIDLMDEWTNRGVSNNWVQWWWNAVDALNLDLTAMQAAMGWYKSVGFDNFIEWVDYVDNSETMYSGLRSEHDIGPGSEYEITDFDDSVEKHINNPELYNDLNKRFPLLPTEARPSVTTLDLVFCELLLVWARAIKRLSRLAMVDCQVKKPQDALPREEYMGDNFIKYFIAPPQRTKKTSAFKKAVQETNEELYSDIGCIPEQGLDEDFYPDYDNDDNYKKVDLPPEKVKTIVIHEFEARKVTPLPELPAKLDFYFNTAWKILGIDNDGKKYQALGKFYDDIDKENGGYIDGSPQLPSDDIESSILAEKLRLVEPSGKRKETDVLKDYLQRVEKLITQGDDVTNIGGEVTIFEGWDWNPVEGKYPAVVILEWLMINIRKEMRNLHRQAGYFEDIPKHKFIVHGHWDFIINDDDTGDWRYIEEQKYVTDDDLDRTSLPEWITGKSGSEESKSVEDKKGFSAQQLNEEKKETIDHIMMDEDKAKKLYKALNHERVAWLIEPKDESEFVNILTSKPGAKKIKLHYLNQIYHISKKYIYPPKYGKKKGNMKSEEWDIIEQVFDAEGYNIKHVRTAYKKPQKSDYLDALMGK